MKLKYDWDNIQSDYDDGMSQGKLIEKYGMSSATLVKAARKGRLKTRSISEALSLYYTNNPNKNPAKRPEVREKLRVAIQKRYDNGWMPKAGRCKKISYTSEIAGKISVDGSWELKVAKYFDELKLNWIRNTKKFPYYDDKNMLRKYTPDFYVNEWKTYIEVKGYETDLDRSKWRHFPDKIEIWKKRDLIQRNIL